MNFFKAIWECMISNKSTITLLIAIAGLALSIYNFLYSLIRNHVHIRITYKNHLCGDSQPGFVLIMMNIENLSHLPISVSRMFLDVGNKHYEFSALPKFAYEQTRRIGNTNIDTVTTHSTGIPFSIPPLGIIGGFFHVVGPFDNQMFISQKTSITLWTTRGKQKYDIVLDNEENFPD